MKELRFINLFRAVAAYWVLVEHCKIWGGWQEFWLPNAKMAVDVFMVISGYLMAAHAIERVGDESLAGSPHRWSNWIRFWARRFFRIAPAYYLSLVLIFATGTYFLQGFQVWRDLSPAQWAWTGSEVYLPSRIVYSAENFAWHISFLFGLHPQWSFSTFLPDWSLSLEMQFYLVFPVLWVAVHRWGALRVTLCLGIPVFFFGVLMSRHVHYYEPSLLIFKLNYFLAGMAACCAGSLSQSRRQRQYLAAAAIALVSLGIRQDRQMVLLPLLMGLLLLLAWLEANRRLPQWLAFALDAKALHFASNASYSVYLFHGFFIAAAGYWVGTHPSAQSLAASTRTLLLLLFVTAGSYAWAYFVHRFIELPGIKLGRKWMTPRTSAIPA